MGVVWEDTEITTECIDCGETFTYIKTCRQAKIRTRCEACKILKRREVNRKNHYIARRTEQAELDRIAIKRTKKKKREGLGIDEVCKLAEENRMTYGKMRAVLRRERMKQDDELRLRYLRNDADGNESETLSL